jgi:hypothetical protein
MGIEEIDKHRERYPIPFEEISKYDSFEQVLGKKPEDYTEDERKRRWNKQMSFSKSVRELWSDTTECNGCIHLDKKGSWCNLQGLPCCVNPILTFRQGMIGMACMGTGKEEIKQLTLEL